MFSRNEKITWLIVSVMVVVAMYLTIKSGVENNKQYELKITTKNECIKKNSSIILKSINDCVSSLKVEENAYAIETCRDTVQAVFCN